MTWMIKKAVIAPDMIKEAYKIGSQKAMDGIKIKGLNSFCFDAIFV